MTVEEFVNLDTADTEAYELVDGVLLPLACPLPIHSVVKDRLIERIGTYFDKHPFGGAISATDCRIAPCIVRRPDLAVFFNDKWQKIDLKTSPIPFAPDIAIKVLSPSDQVQPLNRKIRDYFSAGSQEVWIIDPDGDIEIRNKTTVRIFGGTETLETPLLPGFSVAVEKLLA